MKMAMFYCRKSYEFYHKYKDEFGVYTPIERRRVIRDSKVVVVKSSALGGMVFCPLRRAPALRRAAPGIYNLRQRYDHNAMAVTVLQSELVRMQMKLNEMFEGEVKAPTEASWFEVGDRVQVDEHRFLVGLVGVVQRVKSDGRVRLKMEDGGLLDIVEIHKEFLKKCN